MSVNIEWAKKEMERTGKNNCNRDFIYYVMRGKRFNNRIDYVVFPNNTLKQGDVIYYSYKNKSGNIVLNKKEKQRLLISCDEKTLEIEFSNLKKCNIGKLVDNFGDYSFKEDEIIGDSIVIKKTYTTNKNGFQEKSYVLKCIETKNTYTMTEANLKQGKNSPFVSNKRVWSGNSLFNNKHIMPFLIDIRDSHRYSISSNKPIHLRCPNCGMYKKINQISHLKDRNFSCALCGKGVSYPEKVMTAILELNKIEYIPQKKFKKMNNYRFDFYLPQKNMVIETHGIQHYEDVKYFNTKITQSSDAAKKKYCKENNIEYIDIDARQSTLEHILKDVRKKLNFLEISIKKIQKFISKSFVYDVNKIKHLYVTEKMSALKVAEIIGVSETTINRLLKFMGVKKRDNNKKIKCKNTGREFNSIKEASEWIGCNDKGNIRQNILGNRPYAYRHPITGEKLYWEYVIDEN